MSAVAEKNCDTLVAETIADAFAFVTAGKAELAVNAFSLARQMAVSLAHPGKLAARIAADSARHRKEREAFRARFAKRHLKGAKPLLIFADSLGLPRPDQSEGGAERTYSWLLGDEPHRRNVTPICQRFFTTAEVLSEIIADETLGRQGEVLIHVGLNDCANRMFLVDERLALAFLTPETSKQVVEFARLHRRDILRYLPPRHYVTLEGFRSNLDTSVSILRARGAQKITLATIILPPTKFWPATPGINRGFAQYNMEIMHVVHRHELHLLDVDRIMWENHHRGSLLPDGMHLADLGHQLFAKNVAAG